VKTIVVSGALANRAFNGGGAWVRLSWLAGFKRLGFRVYFLEEIGPKACVNRNGNACSFGESANRAYFEEVIGQFGLSESAALIYEGGKATSGPRFAELLEIAAAAELLVNISGHLSLPPLLARFRRKAYIDIDPGFTQFWHADGKPGSRLSGHDFYFTIAENIGNPGCSIPAAGIAWRPMRQPVVLEDWPVCAPEDSGRFTSVASWRGPYGPVEHGGQTLGLKVHEFRKFLDLPRLTGQRFEIALDIHPDDRTDRQSLRRHGWQIADPKEVVPDPAAFRRYVQSSGAEFSAAQGMYVATASGWFSDRTTRYLASGKPALVQDTGFSRNYPVGDGLIAFRTPEEAAAGAARIARDYAAHCRAARALAETYFDSDKVLGRFLDEVGLGP
jgi:hypothetical protein